MISKSACKPFFLITTNRIKMTQNNNQANQSVNYLPETATNIPVLSFFTGAGFLDIGFMQAGFETIWCNEYEPAFARGFEYGMSTLTGTKDEYKIHNTKSIDDIDAKEITEQAFDGTQQPSIFGIIGGSPCSDFSRYGKQLGKDGPKGRLTQVYVDRIIALQPTFFLLENVPWLQRAKKHKTFFYDIIEQLSGDYEVVFQILNALEFGVPQDRQRLFIIGFHQKWLEKHVGAQRLGNEWFPWPEDKRYIGAKKRYHWPRESPFGTTPPKPEDIPEELTVHPFICDQEELAQLPNGTETCEPRSPKFKTVPEGKVSGRSFRRLHRWRYSPTAAYGNLEVHLHPILPRRLSVREALRIQSVPDEYALPPDMALTHKFKTICNGVPVTLARAVAFSIAAVLEGKINKRVELAEGS